MLARFHHPAHHQALAVGLKILELLFADDIPLVAIEAQE
jgi:hypothetical protein